MSENQCNIISNLRKYRRFTGLTLMRLAKLTGFTTTSLSQWEKGKRFPNLYNAIVIINVLNEVLGKRKNSGFNVKPGLTLDSIWEIKNNTKGEAQ
jgi:DNA-binding XRE family transcriptional regulator